MPGGDRTGPLGQGPMSGRGAGFCRGFGGGGYMDNSRAGRSGRGRGRGWAMNYGPMDTPANDAETLRMEAGRLESSLEAIKRQLEQLEKKKESDTKK